MADGGVKKTMICVDCSMVITATIKQAKIHGWTLWVGGGLCWLCQKDRDAVAKGRG